jgi:glutamine synthetase
MVKYAIEYVWIDGKGKLRSKIRTTPTTDFKDLVWNCDGSSCDLATVEDSEVNLFPIQLYPNILLEQKVKEYPCNLPDQPFIECFYLLCHAENKITAKSSFLDALQIFQHTIVNESISWFGLEQEYFIVDPITHLPIGFGEMKVSGKSVKLHQMEPELKQGPYYCGVGNIQKIGRKIAEKHYSLCLSTGLGISGINAEVAFAQWEFQIGPVEGIEAANQLWMARYLLMRVAEEEGYDITFEPKPITWGSWNGSGLHTNFSTLSMREEGGLQVILDSMPFLKEKHQEHLAVYGTGNEFRLSGKHETSNMKEFTYGFGTRNTSVRIGFQTQREGKGYFEDRRPSANGDPYQICSILCKTILIQEEL